MKKMVLSAVAAVSLLSVVPVASADATITTKMEMQHNSSTAKQVKISKEVSEIRSFNEGQFIPDFIYYKESDSEGIWSGKLSLVRLSLGFFSTAYYSGTVYYQYND